MLKLKIPIERRKGSLGVHRSCSLPKVLSMKYVIHRNFANPSCLALLKKPAHHWAVAMEGRKKTATVSTQTFSAQNFHGVLFFLPTSYTSCEEIKFRAFSVLRPHTSLLCVQKSIRHCRQFLLKIQVKRCVEVCTTSNKARRADLLLWVYVWECIFQLSC